MQASHGDEAPRIRRTPAVTPPGARAAVATGPGDGGSRAAAGRPGVDARRDVAPPLPAPASSSEAEGEARGSPAAPLLFLRERADSVDVGRRDRGTTGADSGGVEGAETGLPGSPPRVVERQRSNSSMNLGGGRTSGLVSDDSSSDDGDAAIAAAFAFGDASPLAPAPGGAGAAGTAGGAGAAAGERSGKAGRVVSVSADGPDCTPMAEAATAAAQRNGQADPRAAAAGGEAGETASGDAAPEESSGGAGGGGERRGSDGGGLYDGDDGDLDTHAAVTRIAALPEEVEEGNVEYKLKLAPDRERLERLITQMHWRLREGAGEAIYEVGIADDGTPCGVSEDELRSSVDTLRTMARSLGASAHVLRVHRGDDGEDSRVAEVLIRQLVAGGGAVELRVAVVGNVDSGKSTLIGVLTKGGLDNGRGLKRLDVFRHKHEVENGRTSSVSCHVVGFDAGGEVINYAGVHGMSAQEVAASAAKLVSLIDLAGHDRYLKTTVFGLTGHIPAFACLALGANMGVQRMTKEHLGVALALKVPTFVIITKIDIAPEHVRKHTIATIKRLLSGRGADKLPIMVNGEADVLTAARSIAQGRVVPIFQVSNVTGEGLALVRSFLNLLPAPTAEWEKQRSRAAEVVVDDAFKVSGVGTVISGTVFRGVVRSGASMLLGPNSLGEFDAVAVKSIHMHRSPVREAGAGQAASFAVKATRGDKLRKEAVRKGMVLVAPRAAPRATRDFLASVLVLHHPTTIKTNYQPMVHARTVRQNARMVALRAGANAGKGKGKGKGGAAAGGAACLRTGDRAVVHFRFLYHPEYVTAGTPLLFREGRTKGIGTIIRPLFGDEAREPLPLGAAGGGAGAHAARTEATTAASTSTGNGAGAGAPGSPPAASPGRSKGKRSKRGGAQGRGHPSPPGPRARARSGSSEG